MYFSFALAGHRGTCLRPLHIFTLLCFEAIHFKRSVTKTADDINLAHSGNKHAQLTQWKDFRNGTPPKL